MRQTNDYGKKVCHSLIVVIVSVFLAFTHDVQCKRWRLNFESRARITATFKPFSRLVHQSFNFLLHFFFQWKQIKCCDYSYSGALPSVLSKPHELSNCWLLSWNQDTLIYISRCISLFGDDKAHTTFICSLNLVSVTWKKFLREFNFCFSLDFFGNLKLGLKLCGLFLCFKRLEF